MLTKLREQVKRGIEDERREHPWLSTKQLEHLVEDHIKTNPGMYKK